jgi:hypothetical protein
MVSSNCCFFHKVAGKNCQVTILQPFELGNDRCNSVGLLFTDLFRLSKKQQPIEIMPYLITPLGESSNRFLVSSCIFVKLQSG